MDGFSISKILAGLRNPDLYLKKIKPDNESNNIMNQQNSANSFNSTLSNSKTNYLNGSQQTLAMNNQLPMNQIAGMDRSVYVKNLLGLPQTLGEILLAVQDKNKPINVNTLTLNNLNQQLLQNQKALSQIFDTAEIAVNTNPDAFAIAQNVQTTQKDAVMLFFSGMIHMPAISEMILKNSKQAVASLIIAMASASKEGMNSEQIRETLSIINSCVAMAESGNPAQTLKSLMMLYLPWLPLNEGIGFDLEVEAPDGENESINSKLTVLIQTVNFGNIKGIFTLTTSNSIDIYIACPEGFPKKTLQQSLMAESSSLSMNTTIDVESVQLQKDTKLDTRQAKVNLSATNEMNPYLLLMAHAFIRNTICIDTNGVIEDSSADD